MTCKGGFRLGAWRWSTWVLFLSCVIWAAFSAVAEPKKDPAIRQVEQFVDGGRKKGLNNWAVLVCASRFWFNYRHVANALSIYYTVKRLGIPDSHIILMLAEDVACDPRNSSPATVFNRVNSQTNLYLENTQVDYRGYDVTVKNFVQLMTGRTRSSTPRSKKLLSDDKSNILLYMTGHGGEEFLKFQDSEEITSYDLADVFEQMREQRRFHEILYMIDTCQATSLYNKFRTKGVLAAGSSMTGENSYSYQTDKNLGVAVIDRWTYYLLEYLNGVDIHSRKTIQDMLDSLDPKLLMSTPGVRFDLFSRSPNQTLITDFFGFVQRVDLTDSKPPLIGRSFPPPPRTLQRASVNLPETGTGLAVTVLKPGMEIKERRADKNAYVIAALGAVLGIVLLSAV